MNGKTTLLSTGSLVALLCIVAAAPLPATAGSTYWQYDPNFIGDWFNPSHWTSGVPDALDYTYVDNGGTALISGGFADALNLYAGHSGGGAVMHTGGCNDVEALYLGYGTDSTGTYELSDNGELHTYLSQYVGYDGNGTFTQSGGTNTVDYYLNLGHDPNSTGIYELSGGELSAQQQYVGYAGTGAFTQTGGTNTVDNYLYLGHAGSSTGTYDLGGDGQLLASYECVGDDGAGTFTQTGGTNTIQWDLSLGSHVGSTGMYHLSVDGQLLATDENVGYHGTGTFVQTGGTNTVEECLHLGRDSNSTGTYELSGTGELSADYEYVGYGGAGTFTQTGGINTVASTLRLGYEDDSNGTYQLSGAGQLSAEDEFVGYRGNGTFTHTGGTNTVTYSLYLGYDDDANGTYHLGGASVLTASNVTVGRDGNGTFVQAGGTHTIGSTLSLAYSAGSVGTYELGGDGELTAGMETIGNGGSGTFTQTGGTNTVTGGLYLAGWWTGEGTYELSGDGQLSAAHEHVGSHGSGTFIQTGGTNTITDSLYVGQLGPGTYELSGSAELSAAAEYVGRNGSGTFTQSGGTNAVGYLHVGPNGRYVLTGGTLELDTFMVLDGELDFAGSGVALAWDDVGVNFTQGDVLNAGSASLSLGPNTVLMVPAGFDPNAVFGSFSSDGIVHTVGATLVVSAGSSLTWAGPIDDHVYCEGTIAPVTGKNVDMAAGLEVAGAGSVDLGWGTLIVNDVVSGITGGQISTGEFHIADSNTGTFTQTAGTVQAEWLSLGSEADEGQPGQTALYNLLGGELRAPFITMRDGNGTLVVDGGQLINPEQPVKGQEPYDVGFNFGGSDGHFTLAGPDARLALGDPWEGWFEMYGNNTFTQAGGIVVCRTLWLSGMDDPDPDLAEHPAYTIEAGELLVHNPEPWDFALLVGTGATFTQTGGTVTVEGSLAVMGECEGKGRLTISGGEMHVLCGYDDEYGQWYGGLVQVGASWGADGNGALTVSGDALLRAGGLIVGPTAIGAKGQEPFWPSTLCMEGGRIVLDGMFVHPWENSTASTIGGRLEGWGTISSVEPIGFLPWATLAPMGGTLTLDFDANVPAALDVQIPADAGLRMRGVMAAGVDNAGTLSAYGGDLHLAGDLVNTGTLANAACTNLYVHAVSLDHTGSVEVNAGGGVSFNQAIVNHAGREIAMLGGVLTAPQITNAPGGTVRGTGTITAELVNQGETDFFGSVQVFGNVTNEVGAELGLRNGDLLIVGDTHNDGRIKVTNGQAYFEGNLTGDGELDIDPALAVVVGDLEIGPGGFVTADGGSTLQLMGDFRNESTRDEDFDLSAGTVQFHGTGVQELEAAGEDIGACLAGWTDNFALGVLLIEPGAIVRLVDDSDNSAGGGGDPEAVYVGELVIQPGGWIDLNGLHLYYLNGGDPKELFYGDSDLDGDVDWRDYVALKQHFGEFAGDASWSDSDMTGDGVVDYWDYVAVRDNYGSVTELIAPPAGAIPEPATLLLVALPAAALLRRRRG